MTNDDNERLTEKIDEDKENETYENMVNYGGRMFRTGFLAGLVGLLPITAGSGFIAGTLCQESKTTVAKRAAMALYEPVGNGGALSAMSTVKPDSHYTFGLLNHYEPDLSPMNIMTPEGFRRLSERRQTMYRLMDKVYWAARYQ
ncbi:MAG: hypothetical protein Q8L34_05155 [Candidatus Woesearchaeota archaeon]|nr:hypothetical protein [Candidatus Woesearchaeota archaeon]